MQSQRQKMSPPARKQGPEQPRRHYWVARASVTCGVTGFLLLGTNLVSGTFNEIGGPLLDAFTILMLLSPVLAILLGCVGLSQPETNPNLHRWQAWAGLILGLIFLGVYGGLMYLSVASGP